MSDKISINSKLKLNALGNSYNIIYIFIIPFLLPLFREQFHINYVQAGLILTIHVALRSIFSLLFGYLGDQYDKRAIIAGGFVFSSIFLGGLIWANNINTIIAFLLLLAIGVSTFTPLAFAIVRENTKTHQRGHYLSLFSAAGTGGLVIASILFGFFVRMWGWKITCFLLSLPGYWLAYAYLKSKKGKKNHKAEAERKIKKSYVYLFFASLGFRSLGDWAILSFLPIYATEYIGLKPEISAWIIAINFIGEFLGNLISSRIIDKNSSLILALSATISVTFIIIAITLIAQPIIIVLLVGILGILQGIYFPSQNTWLTFIAPLNCQGRMFGRSSFVQGFSATIAPALYGWIAEQTSLICAYRFTSIPLIISFTLIGLIYFLESRSNRVLSTRKI